jgi:predicted metal-binding protein
MELAHQMVPRLEEISGKAGRRSSSNTKMNKIDDRLKSSLEALCREARKLGASEAVVIAAGQIVVDERVALKCLVPACANYGVNLMCPPNTMPLDQLRRILKNYHGAILVRVGDNSSGMPKKVADQNSLSKAWGMNKAANGDKKDRDSVTDYMQALRRSQEKLYDIIERIESLCLKEGYNFAAGLSAGGCSLCDKCVGVSSGLPCRHPFRARPSMEGMGIDVLATAKNAGLQLNFNQGTISWVGLILVD